MSVRFRALLGSYCGILQCNGYAAHKSLADLAARCEPSVLAFCWSHVSRDFNIRAKGSAAPIATEALTRIAALCRIDTDIRGLCPAERLAARQARSRPVVSELRV